MDKRIVFARTDGGVSVVVPTGEVPIEQLVKQVVPVGAAYKIVDSNEISSDRSFRNAWVFKDQKIDVDLPKAIALTQSRIREQRVSEFQKLDQEFMTAVEDNNSASLKQVADKKKALRDATQHPKIINATSVDSLKNLGLADLT